MLEEVRNAVTRLKNNKAPGTYGLQAKLLKFGTASLKENICHLAQLIWKQKMLPYESNVNITLPIHKKVDNLVDSRQLKHIVNLLGLQS